MKDLLRSLGLTENEIKVYEALLKLRKGTKSPIVKEAKVLSSKVYEILDKLVNRGLVTFFIENNVRQYVPVHPSNIRILFDDKIKALETQRTQLEKYVSAQWPEEESHHTKVQVFRGWNGLRSAFGILLSDLKKGDIYYILGANAGEDFDKAMEFFPQIVSMFDKKGITRKVIFRGDRKHEADAYFKVNGKKGWNVRYYPTIGPLEIGITNNYVMLSLLEKDPVVTLLRSVKMRNSFVQHFNTIWKQSK